MISSEDALKELYRRIARQNLYRYRPYGHPDTLCPDGVMWKKLHEKKKLQAWSNKPWQLEFHAAGKNHPERLIISGNRVGKTWSACAEDAFHLIGEYPDWWEGRVFDKPITAWVVAVTNETSRDVLQKILLGKPTGTGLIPGDKIKKISYRQAGVSDVVDTVQVEHKNGISLCTFKTYEQGWRKFMGAAPEVIHLDEEDDGFKIYTECRTRLITSKGIMYSTFTPLLGETDLVRHFANDTDPKSGKFMVTATWDDVPHLLEDDKVQLLKSYPEHERDARKFGIPMMGEGRVFTIAESEYVIDPVSIPKHWARLCGIDFGIDHPAAAGWIAWDRDTDTVYVYDCYRKAGETPPYHASAIRQRGLWIPVSWPHDGLNREKGGGRQLKDLYEDEGLNMLPMSARYDKDKGGGQPVEPIVMEVLERMQTGRLKVFSTCIPFLDEARNYHRKDGKIVDKRDDTLKSVFYALMMKRYAIPEYRPVHRSSYTQSVLSMR